jgi:glycosyltransferase involved in cell wall biosynthesis
MKVSVIVPVYNVEQYVRQCAQSLFSQTWEDIEFIFVDDGSPDNSIAIIQEVLEGFPQRKESTKILRQENK